MKKQLLFLLFALLALCASAEPNDVFSVGDITYSVIHIAITGRIFKKYALMIRPSNNSRFKKKGEAVFLL